MIASTIIAHSGHIRDSLSTIMNKGKMKIGFNLSKLEIGKSKDAGEASAGSSGFGSFGSSKKVQPEKSIENEVSNNN